MRTCRNSNDIKLMCSSVFCHNTFRDKLFDAVLVYINDVNIRPVKYVVVILFQRRPLPAKHV